MVLTYLPKVPVPPPFFLNHPCLRASYKAIRVVGMVCHVCVLYLFVLEEKECVIVDDSPALFPTVPITTCCT